MSISDRDCNRAWSSQKIWFSVLLLMTSSVMVDHSLFTVLCCRESSCSALKAAKIRWLHLFNSVDSSLEQWVLDQMHFVLSMFSLGAACASAGVIDLLMDVGRTYSAPNIL